jgi:hypothetical protein
MISSLYTTAYIDREMFCSLPENADSADYSLSRTYAASGGCRDKIRLNRATEINLSSNAMATPQPYARTKISENRASQQVHCPNDRIELSNLKRCRALSQQAIRYPAGTRSDCSTKAFGL